MSITQASLIDEYLKLKNQQQLIDDKLSDLEKRILDFSQKHKLKRLKTKDHLLYIVQKTQTTFPKKGSLQRKLLEKVISSSPDRDQVLSFDIIKLARVYDQKKLSPGLMKKLKPFVLKKPFVKISLIPANRR